MTTKRRSVLVTFLHTDLVNLMQALQKSVPRTPGMAPLAFLDCDCPPPL